MSYLVLARKYRPSNFEEIIGQQHVTRTLQNAVRSNKVHHAFLFTGTRGVGKTTTARVLAKALCCQNSDGPTAEPCGECASCKGIATGNWVDVNEIDGASSNSVNDVRVLRDNVQYRPQQSRYKIYIIDEVHMLSTAAFNALLKTLEEPPEHVKFMFATTESHKIPQTILSRCQRYDFKSVAAAELVELSRTLCERESIQISDGGLRIVARMARGSVRDNLSLLDSVIAYGGENVTDEDVRLVLGLADAALFSRITRALVARDGAALFDAVADLVDYGHDIRQFGSDFLEYLRDMLLVATAPASANQVGRPEAEVAEIKELSKQAEVSEWVAWFDLMVEGQERIARSEQARYMLELTLAKMIQVGKLRSIDDLLAGLGKLSRSIGTGSAAAAPPPASRRAPRPRSLANDESGAPPNNVIDLHQSEPMEQQAAPGNWKDLVSRVKTQSRTLWATLNKVGVLEFSENTIRLECPRDTMAWQEIGDKDGRRKLEQLFSNIFGHPVSVTVEGCENKEAQALSLHEEARRQKKEHRQEVTRHGEQDPQARIVQEVFGGGKIAVNVRRK